MPAIIITGHPRIGKTTVAQLIALRAKRRFHVTNVVIVNEENVIQDRTKAECYVNSHVEKQTRSALKSAFERALASSPDTLVILDSLNYIKGYRYELHCISRSMRQQHCVLWVWNESSYLEGSGMTQEQVDALVMRYEAPDERNRWDKPLYKLNLSVGENGDVSGGGQASVERSVVKKSVYDMHNLSASLVGKANSDGKTFHPESHGVGNEDDDDCGEHTSDDEATKRRLTAAVDDVLDQFLNNEKRLHQNTSTQKVIAAESNVLNQVDRIAQIVIEKITAVQKLGGLYSQHYDGKGMIRLDRKASMVELRRLKRQFVKWISINPPADCSEIGVSYSFLVYIQGQV